VSIDFEKYDPEAFAFMRHIFYCATCPRVVKFSDLVWANADGLTPDRRDADRAGIVSKFMVGRPVMERLCPEGFVLANSAAARGRGS
jgi:hypothetical protein